MADNVSVTPGVGASIASDDVGGIQFQKVKIDVGGDGASAPLSSTNPLPVSLVSAGIFAEDAQHASGDNGIQILAVRKDAATALAGADGDYIPFQVDANGALRVTGAGGGTQYSEDAAHVSGDTGTLALVVRKDVAATIAGSDGDYGAMQVTATGALRVAIAEDAVGSTTDTDDGAIAPAQASIALTIGMPHVYDGQNWVRGGLTPYKLNSAATTNATSLKASAGIIGLIVVTNINAAVRYLKFYNKASAPTVGTDVPVQVYTIPGSTTGGGIAVPIPDEGIAFSTGIAFAITAGAADSDTTAVALNEIIVNLGYK
jgi:hypothetical protein